MLFYFKYKLLVILIVLILTFFLPRSLPSFSLIKILHHVRNLTVSSTWINDYMVAKILQTNLLTE